jgi:hypothetical protein
MLEIQPRADLAQPRPAGREEPAQGTARAQAVEPCLPLLGAGLQAVEDLGHLTRDRRLALAKQSFSMAYPAAMLAPFSKLLPT